MSSNSFSILNRRQIGLFVAAGALLLALVLPTIAGAAQLTARSVELTSSSINAPAASVTYNVKFTSVGAAGAAVIEFCGNSPLIGATCDTPTGFSATSVASTFGTVTAVDANTVKVVGTIAATTAISIPLANITNPSVVGPMYARIVTYDTDANATAHNTAETFEQDANRVDEGGAAISITDSIGVSAAVLESMSFCVSGAIIAENCVGASATPPTLKLGEEVTTGVTALSSAQISTGDIFTQISTNAASGAVVNLKSNATSCGGLKRAGAPAACDITPVVASGFLAGQAKFGVKTNASVNSATGTASGIYRPFDGSVYTPTDYLMNFAADNLTGITSPYGDPFLDTAGAPVNNKNIKLTFGASVSNDTPAGLYSVDLGLIATGKF